MGKTPFFLASLAIRRKTGSDAFCQYSIVLYYQMERTTLVQLFNLFLLCCILKLTLIAITIHPFIFPAFCAHGWLSMPAFACLYTRFRLSRSLAVGRKQQGKLYA